MLLKHSSMAQKEFDREEKKKTRMRKALQGNGLYGIGASASTLGKLPILRSTLYT